MTDRQAPGDGLRLAIDIGGTFTDATVFDPADRTLRSGKALTTPDDLADGVVDALAQAGVDLAEVAMLVHGSTVAINALLERTGARTLLLTTRGARDVYEIGRANRPDSFNLFFTKHRPLVPRSAVVEVHERLDSDGNVVEELTDDEIARVVGEVERFDAEAVAILFLHSYKEPKHERRLRAAVAGAAPGRFVTASHEISREYREFERTSTTVANAYVGPRVAGYLTDLTKRLSEGGLEGELLLMQSAGGLYDVESAKQNCIQLLESGPAGGVVGVASLCEELDIANAVAFDMGGTTAKACVVIDGRPSLARDYFIGSYNDGLPIHIPVLDIEEIGTGGGSIASIDEGESLRVGPRSAGAVPGPACYGRGGTEPTITDAHLVLGRLGPESMMGGRMSLDVDAARRAMRASVGERLGLEAEHVASGIIEIANGAMANAIRAVTLDQGMDPRDFVLVAYGGAGALHAAELARELGIREVVIPPTPGHFSARGMLSADLRRDVAITHFAPLADLDPEAMARLFDTIEVEGREWFDSRGLHGDDVETVRSIDMRYVGQEHSVTIPVSAEDGGILPPERIKQAFDLLHDRMFGHAAPNETVECVTFRSSLVWPTEKVTSTAGATGHEPRRPSGSKPARQGMFHHSEGWVALEVFDRRSLPSDVAIVGPAVVEEDATSTLVPPGAWVSVGRLGELRIRFGSGPTTGKEQ